MGHTYTALHYHIVFGTKGRVPSIQPDVQTSLYDYIAGIVRRENGIPLALGGMPDHIHVLATLHPSICVAEMLRLIKTNSSKWMHEHLPGLRNFAWQSGYAAFTVSRSALGGVEVYIMNQQTHHARLSFEDEFLAFLQRHGIPYDKQYVVG